jgi:prepilin peptidase CpaA
VFGAAPLSPLVTCLLLALVFAAAVFDIRLRRIPNWLSATGIALGFAARVFERGLWSGLLFSAEGFILALAVYLFLYALHAMGAGDGKLMAAAGALAGWKAWAGIFAITAIFGGIAALALSIARGRLRKTLWNTGVALSEMGHGRPPHLANEELDVRGSKGMRLPHGVSIAVGTMAYLLITHYIT